MSASNWYVLSICDRSKIGFIFALSLSLSLTNRHRAGPQRLTHSQAHANLHTCRILVLTLMSHCIAVSLQHVASIKTNQFLHRSRKNQNIDEVYTWLKVWNWLLFYFMSVGCILVWVVLREKEELRAHNPPKYIPLTVLYFEGLSHLFFLKKCMNVFVLVKVYKQFQLYIYGS